MDNLTVALEIKDGNADVVIGKNKQRLGDFKREVEKIQPQIRFRIPNESFIDLDRLEKKAAETRRAFQNIASARLDAGQVNGLTKDIVRASERSQQLYRDIANIKREILNPNRKSSIAFLTEELRAAEREADQLARKLQTVSAGDGAAPAIPGKTSAGRVAGGGGAHRTLFKNGRIVGLGAVFREFAPEGINESVVNAGLVGSQLAGIASATLVSFGAIAAIGYGIVKVTEHIRSEAEKRLKYEEQIAATMNKQVLASQEIIRNFEAERQNAADDRRFGTFLQGGTVEELTRRRDLLVKLHELTAAQVAYGNSYGTEGEKERNRVANQRREDEIKALEAQIFTLGVKKESDRTKAFDQRFEDFKKEQELQRRSVEQSFRLALQNPNNSLSELRKMLENVQSSSYLLPNARQALSYEIESKIKESVEQGKAKVKELQKQYESSFDALYLRANASNPFVTLYSEADKSLRNFRENSQGLSLDLIAEFEAIEKKAFSLKLFEARIDNRLGVFDLRNDAGNFRSPYDPEKDKLQQERYVQNFLSRNPNYLFLKRQEYDAIERTTGYKNSQSFEDFYRKDILKRGSSLFDTPQNRLNKRLEDEYNLLFQPNQTQEQRAIADRKFISLTNGVNPLDLNDKLREEAASVREREALRRENFERDQLAVAKEQLAVQKRLDANQKRLLDLAEKDGVKGIKSIIEIVDKTNGGANVLGASPGPGDMPGLSLGLAGGSGGLFNL
ncbi:MAG: hypothetical protein JSS81_26805 [Acidobacteria bacterium]|nr:hypothetical protein [Acidobacteriota bacterium]